MSLYTNFCTFLYHFCTFLSILCHFYPIFANVSTIFYPSLPVLNQLWPFLYYFFAPYLRPFVFFLFPIINAHEIEAGNFLPQELLQINQIICHFFSWLCTTLLGFKKPHQTKLLKEEIWDKTEETKKWEFCNDLWCHYFAHTLLLKSWKKSPKYSSLTQFWGLLLGDEDDALLLIYCPYRVTRF